MTFIEMLQAFDPEPEGLLRAISKHVTDEMLVGIAGADYGNRWEEHLAALQPIRDANVWPEPSEMLWVPMEVIELTRWSEPENPDNKLGFGYKGQFGHWMRAFCCAALLRATREPHNYGDSLSTDQSLIHLILSLQSLSVDLNREAVRFMAWLLQNSNPEGTDEQVCFYGIGLLWFALRSTKSSSDRSLVFLAQWIVQKEEELRRISWRASDRWLLGIGQGNPPPSDWELLGAELCQMDLTQHQLQLRDWVELIGTKLAG